MDIGFQIYDLLAQAVNQVQNRVDYSYHILNPAVLKGDSQIKQILLFSIKLANNIYNIMK